MFYFLNHLGGGYMTSNVHWIVRYDKCTLLYIYYTSIKTCLKKALPSVNEKPTSMTLEDKNKYKKPEHY